ncbi:ABC transporter substrate-binding protein [Lysinibacter cavernae]|uniref:Putative ABC transport system substrate-binding protein n=1 Tax=Lysinibacter cavernae TaxID=1640652 RepID=A0A7X5R1L7_9MICO|nr:ABC transporter substrate-binding protein [Lysinibacter cavernae]NIH53926.1 putative ABC transport system substrate-binding protein [Lysinibacter cavernae]
MKSKSLLSAAALGLAAALTLTSCASSNDDKAVDAEAITIGITQIAEHPSLDAIRESFKKAITDAGYVEGKTVIFDEQNAQGDQNVAATIAGGFVEKKVDMIVAIATPTAQAAVQATTDIPVVFSAVTDPIGAGIVESMEKPGGNVTGTSDQSPMDKQVDLILEAVPDTKTIGAVFSSGEINSATQIDQLEEAAKAKGITVKRAPASNGNEIATAASTLDDVDAIFVPNDNTVVSGIEAVLAFGESNKIPVFTSDADSVERGAVATYGVDYAKLGEQTGAMALSILDDGNNPGEMPVETITTVELIVNPEAAERMGLTLPESIVSRADQVL